MCVLCQATGRLAENKIVAGFSCSDTVALNSSANTTSSTSLPVYNNNQIAEQLTTGYWGGLNIHYDVAVGGSLSVNMTGLSNAAKTLAQSALDLWSDATGLRFTLTGSASANIVMDDDQSGAYNSFSSYRYVGNNEYHLSQSDLNVSSSWTNYYGTGYNTYSFQTYIHEIGHALGLGHAGNYNGSATYGIDNHYANDSWQTSVMSYFSQNENSYTNASWVYAVTPQVADVIAIRDIYGTTNSTRTGNTVYGDGASSGDIMATLSAMDSYISYTIIDDGGNDTLNYSSESANQRVNLNQEAYSSVRGYTENIAIARGTVIENAITGSGNDTLIGNGAINRLQGNAGNDTYVVNNTGDVVVEFAGGGTDQVYASVSYALRMHSQHLERLTLTGSSNISGTGNGQANIITGNAGNNILNGAYGNDVLRGGAGNDIFRDDNGADRMLGGTGNDTYYIDNRGDVIIETAGQGRDHVNASISYALRTHSQHTETLTLTGSGNISGTGNGQANVITGNAGNNVLNGAWGNDVLRGGAGNDIFRDDNGADRMLGGTGNDTYYIDNRGDVIIETAGQGRDHVNASINYALRTHSQHTETLTLTGSGNISGTGNGQANIITGNAGNNILNGAYGNDVLRGGAGNDIFRDDAGNDRFIGGAGADRFYFRRSNETDVIADFMNGADSIYISSSLGASRFANLRFSQNNANVEVTFGSNKIVLQNMQVNQIDSSDFFFV